MRLRALVVVLCAGAAVAACGSDTGEGGSAPTVDATGPATGANDTADGGSAEACPLTADELSSATSLTWQLSETREDHPLETMESVKVTACLYTAPEARQEAGDPLVARADVVPPADADTVRSDFSSTCTELGGAEQPAGGGTVCERGGVVVDGVVGDLVVISIVNADTATAQTLTPSFAKILAAAS
jgi:hypothetical protein